MNTKMASKVPKWPQKCLNNVIVDTSGTIKGRRSSHND